MSIDLDELRERIEREEKEKFLLKQKDEEEKLKREIEEQVMREMAEREAEIRAEIQRKIDAEIDEKKSTGYFGPILPSSAHNSRGSSLLDQELSR